MNGISIPLGDSTPLRNWLVAVSVLLVAFSYPLYVLVRLSFGNELYSHLALVPFASLFLVWLKRRDLPRPSAPNPRLAILPLAAGVTLLGGYGLAVASGHSLAREDFLAWTMLSFVLLLAGTSALFLGKSLFRALGFPFGLLVFMAPLPSGLERLIETGLQQGSSDVAYWLFRAAGTPIFRQDTVFALPNITLEVAPQCSGIHSTLALFITSLIAGYVLLTSSWRRALLTFAVIPLALLRNGFRVFIIGELCVHVSPEMSHSYIHHHGGPIFFALSLIPFTALLIILIRSERRKTPSPHPNMFLALHRVLTIAVAGLLAFGAGGCSDAARKARRLEMANRYFSAGQYNLAEIEYRNVLQLEPMHPEAIARLGIMFFDQGRISRVYPFLNKARELRPNDLDVRIKLAMYYATIGRVSEAGAEAAFVLERRPQDEDAPVLLAETAHEPREIQPIRARLQELHQRAGDTAPVLVALGMLELRQRNLKGAQAAFDRALALNPESHVAHLAMATLHIAQGQLPEADKSFAQATAHAPARSVIRIRYAQFKSQIGQVDAAKRLVQEITRKTPDYLPAWLLLAEMFVAEKNYDGGLAAIGKVLERDSQHPEALLLGPRVRFAKGDHAKAVAELERAITLYPKSHQLREQLGVIYAAVGEPAKAVACLTEAATLAPESAEITLALAELNIRQGNVNAAITSLKRLVQRRPEMTAARLLLAQAYRAGRNLDEAVLVYQQLSASLPANPQLPYFVGLVFLEQRKNTEARQSFARALQIDPAYLPAIEQLVNLDVADRQFATARARVQTQIDRSPNISGLHLLLARTYLAEGKSKEAESALLNFITLEPDVPMGYYMLAQIYVGSKQHEKAVAQLEIAVRKNPKDISALVLLALISEQQKNFGAAREYYERVLAINSKFGVALNNLAYLCSEHFAEPDKAFSLAQRARELFPREPHLADTLGWVLYKRKQYPWALTLLLESADKLPNSADVQYHLGMTHYMMGEEMPARAALQRAITLDPNFAGSEDARASLTLLAMDPAAASNDDRVTLEKAVTLRPDPVAYARLGKSYEDRGNLEKAATAYNSALTANPNNVAAAINMVRMHMLRNDTAKALELARTTRKLAPEDPHLAHMLGRLAYDTRDHGWAFSLLQETARKLPDNADVLYDLAEAAYSNGQLAITETSLRNALRANPLFPRAARARKFLEMLALAADPVKAAAARSAIEGMLGADPTYVPALMALAALEERRGDFNAARRGYQKSLEQFPNFSPARRGLTLVNARAKSPDGDAVEIASKARAAFPDDPDLAKAFGIILHRQGDNGRALTMLQQSCRQRPTDPEAFYYLGVVQHRLKDGSGSTRSLQRALELGLTGDSATEARRLMKPSS